MSGAQMKVAYLGIHGLPSKGGAERVVEAVATRMPPLGFSPTVYCDQRYTPPGASVPGVRLVRLPTMSGKYLRQSTLDLLAALHAVFCERYDLIHLQHSEASFVLPLLRLRYPVVATSHGFPYQRAKWSPLAKRLMRMLDWPFMKLSSVTTCVSAKDAGELASRFGQRVVYIPNGALAVRSPVGVQTEALMARHGLSPGEFLIFVAGRIEPTKGAHLAIEVTNRLQEDIPLLVVGDDQQLPDYGRALRSLAGPRVRFEPPVADPNVLFGLMSSALCLLFPSLLEAMSMVLLEAASLGVPIVCSDIPENRSVLGEEAVYFESGNVESLMHKIEWALTNYEDILMISKKVQEKVQTEYCWDTIAARYAELYREVTQERVIGSSEPV